MPAARVADSSLCSAPWLHLTMTEGLIAAVGPARRIQPTGALREEWASSDGRPAENDATK